MTIDAIIKKLEAQELDNPNELSNYLVQLSASLNEAGQRRTIAEIEYSKKWTKLKNEEEKRTDKMTDMLAKSEPEYRIWKDAETAEKCIVETIRSLKKKLQALSLEYKEGY
jgi:hypothetical protein